MTKLDPQFGDRFMQGQARTPAGEVVTPEQLAQRFHETYERLAPSFGYETREASAKPWADVPEKNKRLMIAVCAELLAAAPATSPATGEQVTQIDRDAAANFAQNVLTGWCNIGGNDVAALRNGIWDDDDTDLGQIVQAFANHRAIAIASLNVGSGDADVARLREALAEMLERERRRYEDTPAAQAFFKQNNVKALAALTDSGHEERGS